jgi:hypothetical protein
MEVRLRRSFQKTAILFVTLTLTFRSLAIPESQFSKHHCVRPSYETKAKADSRIPELITFRYVIFRRLKNAGELI